MLTITSVPSVSALLRRLLKENEGAEIEESGVLEARIVIKGDSHKKRILARIYTDEGGSEPFLEGAKFEKNEKLTIIKDLANWITPKYQLSDTDDAPKTENATRYIYKKGGKIAMIKDRIPKLQGGKYFKFWTKWDGEWVNANPPGAALLYTENFKSNAVMLHEGEKAADACRRIRDKKEEHDWADDLRVAHYAWQGSCENITDLKPLEKFNYVFIVADQDERGREAAYSIARKLRGQSVYGITFPETFPSSFDLADEFPRKKDGKKYTLDSMLSLCTWATKRVEKTLFIRKEFSRQWFYIAHLGIFVNKKLPVLRLKKDNFNLLVRPYSDAKDTADIFLRDGGQQVINQVYAPGYRERLVSGEMHNSANIWIDSFVKEEKGEISPVFWEYFEWMIPDKEQRDYLIRLFFTKLAHRRVEQALLLKSRQGTGKSIFIRLLTTLLGVHNVSKPDTEEVDSKFTGWIENVELAAIEEAASGHSWKTPNRLKKIITDRYLNVERKGVDAKMSTSVHCYILMTSNVALPIRLDEDDRRWFAPDINSESPIHEIAEIAKRLFFWLDKQNGWEIVKYHANHVFKDYIDEHERPLETETKDALKSRSGDEWVLDARFLAQQFLHHAHNTEYLLQEDVERHLTSRRKAYSAAVALRRAKREMLLMDGMIEAEGRTKINGKRQWKLAKSKLAFGEGGRAFQVSKLG